MAPKWDRTEIAVFAGATLGSGIASLALGQDGNFDQLNYHVYLGWSLFADRLGVDVAPAGVAGSYFNPVVHAFHYLGLTLLPARVFGVALGAVHGLNAYLAYRLSRLVLRGTSGERLLAAAAGVVAATGPCAVSLLATTFGDNLLSIPILLALLLQLQAVDQAAREPGARLLAAGALAGAAAGLKLTFGVFLLALGCSAVAVSVVRRRRQLPLVFALGAAAGGLAVAGFWCIRLWRMFRNPIFPFLNNVFHSPYFPPVPLSDRRWVLRDWTELATIPLDIALGRTQKLQEIPFRDLRYLVLLFAFTLALSAVVFRRGRAERAPAATGVVLTAWLGAYLTWAVLFHNYRYFAAGEILAPVAVLAALRMIGDRRLFVAGLAIALAIVLTTRTVIWGRIPWRDEPLRVRVPLHEPATVLVNSTGISFALPFFPAGSRFVSFDNNGPAFDRLALQAIASGPSPLLRLRRQGTPQGDRDRFGFVDDEPCQVFRTGGRGRLELCSVRRAWP